VTRLDGNVYVFSRSAVEALRQWRQAEADRKAAMDEASLRYMPTIEAHTGYLSMLGNVATLCGLLGTVSGLIACFAAVRFAYLAPGHQ
jgi:biopolymer transport protein ExbB/TolQ